MIKVFRSPSSTHSIRCLWLILKKHIYGGLVGGRGGGGGGGGFSFMRVFFWFAFLIFYGFVFEIVLFDGAMMQPQDVWMLYS